MCILAERLAAQRDVKVGVLSRPQSRLGDFYRELGDLFGVVLQPHNRWNGVCANVGMLTSTPPTPGRC
jgi:hypothetical protein